MFTETIRQIDRLSCWIVVRLIYGYRYWLSPWLPRCCRFYPSCSLYAKQAFEQRGIIGGMYFTLRRLLRCHPFHSGGVDFLPVKKCGSK